MQGSGYQEKEDSCKHQVLIIIIIIIIIIINSRYNIHYAAYYIILPNLFLNCSVVAKYLTVLHEVDENKTKYY